AESRKVLVAQSRLLQRTQQVVPEIRRRLHELLVIRGTLDQIPRGVALHRADENGKQVAVLAERLPTGRVGVETPLAVPTEVVDRGNQTRGAIFVALGQGFVAQLTRQFRGALQGAGILQRNDRR